MYRIDDKTALPFMPVPEETGTEGYFTEGNRAAGTPATIVRASWLNMVQEELRNIVVAGGLNPSKESNRQVLDALLAKFARRITSAGGTSEQITAIFNPYLTKLTDGVSVLVRAAMGNLSTTPTFQADETARRAIVKGNNLPLVAGDISGEGHWLELHYDAKLDKWVLQNPARGVTPPVIPLSFRNKIINGNFDVWQRGATGVTPSPSGTIFVADRFRVNAEGSTVSVSKQAFPYGQTDVPGNPHFYMRCTVSSTAGINNGSNVQYKIEQVTTLAGKNSTLSFWIRTDTNRKIHVHFRQNFGDSSLPVVNFGGITINTSSQWTKVEIPQEILSISGKSISQNNHVGFIIWMDAGSGFPEAGGIGYQSGTFDFAQFQMEEGEIATPFEHRPVWLELSLCERYCQTGGISNVFYAPVAGSRFVNSTNLRTQMRAWPTLTNTIYNTVNSSNARIEAAGNDLVQTDAIATAAGNTNIYGRYLADAEI